MRFDDTEAAGGDYRYGEAWTDGPQDAVILWATEHESAAGNASLKVTIGLEASKTKVDAYVPLGAGFRDQTLRMDFARSVAPDLIGAGDFEPKSLVGRRCRVEIETEPGSGGYAAKPAVMRRPLIEANGRREMDMTRPRGWLPPAATAPCPRGEVIAPPTQAVTVADAGDDGWGDWS